MTVTSLTDEIQTLLTDLDNVLANKGNRLSKILSGQGQEPRQVLERIRNFLVKLAESEAQAENAQNQHITQHSQRSPLLARFIDQNNQSPPQHNQSNQQESAIEQTQIKSEFSALLIPLQAELQNLLQERASLVAEIRELEQRRLQNYSLAQQLANQEKVISEFLQVLMSRVMTLTPPRAESAPNYQIPPFPTPDTAKKENTEQTISPTQPLAEPRDQVERLTRLAKELDQQMLALDGTVNIVFEALGRNIHTYHESLSQALARMHSKGLQGEQLLANWINNLIQQLQQQNISNQPSTLRVEDETSSVSLSSPVMTDASSKVNDSNQLASHPLEVTDINNYSSTTNIYQEDTLEVLEGNISTPDLDAILLQLNQDTQNLNTNVAKVQHDDSELMSDEVDQLYASLFSSENFDDSSVVIDSTKGEETDTTQEHPDTAPSSTTTPEPVIEDHPDTALSSTPAVNQVQQVEPAVIVPDPWFDDPDAGLLTLRDELTQDTSVNAATQLSDFYQMLISNENSEEGSVTVTGAVEVKDPATIDTISALNELLVNVDGQESVPQEVSPDTEKTNVVPSNTEEVGIPEAVSLKSQDDSSDQYILASPEENLLDQDETSATAAPDISLEEAQLRQLEQDLAEFDQSIDFQAATDLENQVTVESTLTSKNILLQTDAKLELTTPEAHSVEAEKKKELATEEKQESSSSVSISSSIDRTESTNILDSAWYLGIDLGTTGISAALLNRSTTEVYPLYWSPQNQPEGSSIKHSFRLPAEVYLPRVSVTSSETENTPQIAPASIAEEEKRPASSATHNLFSAQLKPYLQVALPYKDKQHKWEPVLQLNEYSTVPLVWVVRSLSKLLLTLKSDPSSTTLGLTAAAVGLSQQNFRRVINNISGVICTCPSSWTEQYRFNVREALLISKLVKHSQQVFFIEEAIASLLSELDGAGGETVELKTVQGSRLVKNSTHLLVGNTLVINIGAASTEMTLVDLPEDLEDLTHSDFMLHGFGYGGKGIDQDIICQLLFPQKWRKSPTEIRDENTSSTGSSAHWQPSIPGLDQMHLSDFVWEELNLPRPGEPDVSDRIGLQQKLDGSLLGKAMLEAAIALKLILQHQDSFTLELADQEWTLQRRDLESQVFVPFVRRLNRELNRLLVAKGIPTEAINQVILTGGVISIGAINRWLRQKLPNAKIIQDSYLDENGTPGCSRVAYGLALLPLHPQVVEVPRQQYTDYFLFTELLKVLPERALSLDEVLQLFENRGINTRSCQQRLLAFLEGELPPGLIPSNLDFHWLSQSTKENSEYQAITGAPLFEKQGNLTYRPNFQQLQLLGHHLDAIKLGTEQSLEEPYTVNFALGVVH